MSWLYTAQCLSFTKAQCLINSFTKALCLDFAKEQCRGGAWGECGLAGPVRERAALASLAVVAALEEVARLAEVAFGVLVLPAVWTNRQGGSCRNAAAPDRGQEGAAQQDVLAGAGAAAGGVGAVGAGED